MLSSAFPPCILLVIQCLGAGVFLNCLVGVIKQNELLALSLEMFVLCTGAQLLYLWHLQLHSWDM